MIKTMPKTLSNKVTKNLIANTLTAILFVVLAVNFNPTKAFADCEQNYGGGETCVFTGRFTIEKWVRLEGDNSWKDEIVIDLDDGDENDKEIQFKIKVTADVTNAEGVDIDEINFDDMEMKDSLPDELKFLEDKSDDDLTEEWDDFKPGETRTFYFTVKIESDEKDREGDFEKCVVNKAKLYFDGDFQGSDDAVVCYKKTTDVLGTSTELPRTGAFPVSAIAGLVSITVGYALKKKS